MIQRRQICEFLMSCFSFVSRTDIETNPIIPKLTAFSGLLTEKVNLSHIQYISRFNRIVLGCPSNIRNSQYLLRSDKMLNTLSMRSRL